MSKEPEELKQEADEYFDLIKVYASHWGKALLIAGGSVYITYRIVKGITAKNREKHKEIQLQELQELQRKQYALASNKPTSRIVRMIKEQLALVLIAIAKQKLTEALKNRKILDESKVV